MCPEPSTESFPAVILVVPCYNEAARLRSKVFLEALARHPTLHLLLVDDGSRDPTLQRLQALAAESDGRITVLALPVNRGKAEAVRQGMLEAFKRNSELVGYWDADLATPFEAVPDFIAAFRKYPEIEVVLGSRVRLLGRHIRRTTARHYVGRVFATGASLVLNLPVYDTQCGAKLFRATDRVRSLFVRPFVTRWIFDVELIARYLDSGNGHYPDSKVPAERLYELALNSWIDEPGSKVRTKDGLRAAADLIRIYLQRRL